MSFKFYITDLIAGNVVGTDDARLAAEYSVSEDFFVVDVENNKWMYPSGGQDIAPAATIEDKEDEDE